MDVPTIVGLAAAFKGLRYGKRILQYGERLAERGLYEVGGRDAIGWGRAWQRGFRPAVLDAVMPTAVGIGTDIGSDRALDSLVGPDASSVFGEIVEVLVPFVGTINSFVKASKDCKWFSGT